MTFNSKLRHALALLDREQIKSQFYQPPIYRLLWSLGAEIAPPHYANFAENWVFSGFIAGFLWSITILFSFILFGLPWAAALLIVVPIGIGVGAAAGYIAARNYRRQSEHFKVPLWKDFHPSD